MRSIALSGTNDKLYDFRLIFVQNFILFEIHLKIYITDKRLGL